MRYLNFRTPIALAVFSAFLALVPAAFAANPGDVEFTPSGGTIYLSAAPTINWAAYGALTGATCQFSKTSSPTSTPFPTTSCTAAVTNAPNVNTASAPTVTSYAWDTAPMVSGDGAYRVTYTPTFASYPTQTATRDFVVDTVNPVVTVSAPNGVTTDNTPQVGYTSQDVNPKMTICAADPVVPIVPPVFEGFSTCPASPYSLPTLADGEHYFYVVSQDQTGNYGYSFKTFTVDATGPLVEITGLAEGDVLTSAWPNLSVRATDPGTGVMLTTCAYDANAQTDCSDSNFLNAPLPDGAHKLNVISTDSAGNITTRVINFRIDTSGGLTQGLTAPKTAKFSVKRGKLKGTKYPTKITVTFALPAGGTAASCSGSAKINVLVKKKQIGSASAKFKASGAKCVATGNAKLSKKFKGKKASIVLAYKLGPIKAFTLYGSGKL